MTEIELKLALPLAPSAGLARKIARTAVLGASQPAHQALHSIYYDTPDQALRRLGMVLRLRRVGKGAGACWLQTFKTTTDVASALSRRGEWEWPLTRPVLSGAALANTPWPGIDPDGSLLARLEPCFETRFTRTRWQVPTAGGSLVEVALDRGQIAAGTRRAPIHEMELELLAGQASELFALAQELARVIPLVPAVDSKSARGYQLASHSSLVLPGPPSGLPDQAPPGLADLVQTSLMAAFGEFTRHLCALGSGEDPEQAHRARVGWRRFKTAQVLFRPLLGTSGPAPTPALRKLLDRLGRMRDLDVACTETVPALERLFVADDKSRAQAWRDMLDDLAGARATAARTVHRTLCAPATGQALLAITQWLDSLGNLHIDEDPCAWARDQVRRLRSKLRAAAPAAQDEARRHRQRILAKRLRYGIEILRPLLPGRRAARWHRHAATVQTDIGRQRDVLQASVLLQAWPAHRAIADFLRGHASAWVNGPPAGPPAR